MIWFNGLSMLLGAAALIDHDRPVAVSEESA